MIGSVIWKHSREVQGDRDDWSDCDILDRTVFYFDTTWTIWAIVSIGPLQHEITWYKIGQLERKSMCNCVMLTVFCFGFLHILLRSSITYFVSCDLWLQRTYCMQLYWNCSQATGTTRVIEMHSRMRHFQNRLLFDLCQTFKMTNLQILLCFLLTSN